MEQFFNSFFGFLVDFLTLLNSWNIYVFGYHYSLFHILIGFLITSIVISVFWKGAKG